MYLVDTNVLSGMRRRDKATPKFVSWVTATPPEEMYLSVLSLFEVRLGALRVARRDAIQGRGLSRWIEGHVMAAFDGRILPIGAEIAQRCAAMHCPDPRPVIVSFIAATALEHGLTVATRNVADFETLGVALFNPWQD